MGDTWHHLERPISIAVRSSSSGVDSNPTVWSSSHRERLGIARFSSDGCNRSWSWRRTWSYHDHKISIERRRKLMEELHDRGAIEPRSRCDRAAIVAPSTRNRSDDSPTWSDGVWLMTRITIDARSWPDRGVIVVPLKWKLRRIYRTSGSHDTARGNRFHDLAKLLPRSHQTASKSGLIFTLKTHVILPCSSTFDRFMKELSEFRSRSLVHRDPPPRFDSIAKQLERDWSQISPWIHRIFPLNSERPRGRIHKNWSPILAEIGLVVRFDWLSGGNLSFY